MEEGRIIFLAASEEGFIRHAYRVRQRPIRCRVRRFHLRTVRHIPDNPFASLNVRYWLPRFAGYAEAEFFSDSLCLAEIENPVIAQHETVAGFVFASLFDAPRVW